MNKPVFVLRELHDERRRSPDRIRAAGRRPRPRALLMAMLLALVVLASSSSSSAPGRGPSGPATSMVQLKLQQPAVPVNAKLFGVGEDWTAALSNWAMPSVAAAMRALHVGQTRFPGGACSNYWNISSGDASQHDLSRSGCTKDGVNYTNRNYWLSRKVANFPPGTFSLPNFMERVAKHCNKTSPIFDLNLFTMTPEQTLATVQTIRNQMGDDAQVMIELGNELYLSQYRCILGQDASKYIAAARQVITGVRTMLPNAKIAIIGFLTELMDDASGDKTPSWGVGTWNKQLRSSGLLGKVDAITQQDYSLSPSSLDTVPRTGRSRESFFVAWPDATMHIMADGMSKEYGPGKQYWITEFGIQGKKYEGSAFLESTRLGALHGIFIITRILAAIARPNVFASLEYFNIGGQVGYGDDVLVNISTTNPPTVNGAGQIFAHVACSALAHEQMQALEVDAQSASSPSLPMQVLRRKLPCIQAAMFSSLSSATVVAINRCNYTIETKLPWNTGTLNYRMVTYEAKVGEGSWAPLPQPGTPHPWDGPLHPMVSSVETMDGQLMLRLPGLSLDVIEREADVGV